MERERYFEATEFENIKEIIYNSAKVYKDNTAFVIKHKEGKNVKYENISYKELLEDIKAKYLKAADIESCLICGMKCIRRLYGST